MNETVTAAVELELRNSINKDFVGYCDRLGSARLIEMAESYGSSSDVVEMADLLISKGIAVFFSSRMRAALDAEQDKAVELEDSKRTDWLDELESKLLIPDPVAKPSMKDMFDSIEEDRQRRRESIASSNAAINNKVNTNEELVRLAKLRKAMEEFDDEGD